MNLEEVTFKSALRPLSGDDLPIVGKNMIIQACRILKIRFDFKKRFSVYFFIYFPLGQTTIPNLYVNTGHGSKGWTLAFGSIKLLADLISQTKPEVF